MHKWFLCASIALGMFVASATVQAASLRTITLGTGNVGGVYYPTGGAIAKIVNMGQAGHHLQVLAEPTAASAHNINAVMSGKMDFGLAQADMHEQAWKGEKAWHDRPQTGLRSVFSLAPEAVTLVVTDDSGIADLAGLRGKTVSLGVPGSGNYNLALTLLKLHGIAPEKNISAVTINPADAPRMLLDGRIDGFFFTVAHPNANIREATTGARTVRFIPITSATPLLEGHPTYTPIAIPIRFYPQVANKEDVPSVGMLATLITSASQPDEVVYTLVKQVFEHLENFKHLHPALSGLTPHGMLKGLTAPLHPGAAKYYKEAGLIQ